jgi:hypothetical protein
MTNPIEISPWQSTKRLILLGVTVFGIGFLVSSPTFLREVFKNNNLRMINKQDSLNES